MIKSAEIQRPYPLGHGGRPLIFFCFLKFIIEVEIFMRQFHCNATYEFRLKYFNMIISDLFSDFSSVESEFCIKLALVSISHVTLL